MYGKGTTSGARLVSARVNYARSTLSRGGSRERGILVLIT